MVAGLLEVKITTCLLFTSLHPFLTGKSLLKTLHIYSWCVLWPWEVIQSKLLLRGGSVLSSNQVNQGFVQSDLENFQNRRFSSLFQCWLLAVERLFFVSNWNLPCFIVLDSGVPGISGAIPLCLFPQKKTPSWMLLLARVVQPEVLTGVTSGHCSNMEVLISRESCFLFCQLRLRNPQLLCAGYKRRTNGSLLKFTDKFKQVFL